MFLVYVDDSGDEKVRCFSALILHESVWHDAHVHIRNYRRELKKTDGILVTRELHATEFVAGRGRLGPEIVSKGRRCEIFRDTLSMIAGLPKIRLMNAVGPKSSEKMLFGRLLNRVHTFVSEWKSRAMIFHDEGKDFTSLARRMRVFNPVPSKYGAWPGGLPYKNIPLTRIIEDIVYRKSDESDLIQMADFCAYALLRSEYPLSSKSRYGLDSAFERLAPICVQAAAKSDRAGIIRC